MARVFTAIDIEDPGLLDELGRIRDRLDLGFNTLEREKMHITLEFFEDISKNEIEEVKDAMPVGMEPFELEVKGVGAFPSTDYIRVVWAGAGNERINELYSRVSDHGVKSSNDHEFKPHVTLARVKNLSGSKKRKLQKSLEEFEEHRFGSFTVDSVKMFESRLTEKGSDYRLLHEEKL